MITIGLIDKYPVAKSGIAVLLSLHFPNACLLVADNTSELEMLNDKSRPDLIILGLNEHHLHGSIKLVRECRRHFPAVSMIAYDQNYYQNSSYSYFKLGVKGQVLKQSPVDELITCIRTVLKGKKYLSPLLHEIVLKAFSHSPQTAQFSKIPLVAN